MNGAWLYDGTTTATLGTLGMLLLEFISALALNVIVKNPLEDCSRLCKHIAL